MTTEFELKLVAATSLITFVRRAEADRMLTAELRTLREGVATSLSLFRHSKPTESDR